MDEAHLLQAHSPGGDAVAAVGLGGLPVGLEGQVKQGLILGNCHGIGGEVVLLPPGIPGVGPLHQPLKAGILEEVLEPVAKSFQAVVVVESLGIGDAPLPHERPEGGIRQRAALAQQPALISDPLVPVLKDGQPGGALLVFVGAGVAVGVFEAVEMMFERTVVLLDQR